MFKGVMQVAVIEKEINNPLTEVMYFFCNVSTFIYRNHIKAFYCLNDTNK